MKTKKFQKDTVFTVSLAHMAHDINSAFLAPLIPLLIEKLGLSLAMVSLLDIIRRIPSLFNPFFGLLAEHVGFKYFVILTPALTAISMGFVGLANSTLILFILLLIAGISAAFFHIPSPVMIKEASGDKVGTGMSFFMVGGEGARTIGPILITAAISWWGLEGTWRLMPIGIIASVILYFKLRNFKLHTSLQKPKQKGDTKKILIKFAPFFAAIGGFILFQTWMKSALVLYLPVYMKEQGFGLWYAGISLAVLELFGVIGTLFAGHYSDKIGRTNMLLISSIGAALSMSLFIVSNDFFILPILACIGFFLFATGPVLMALVQDTNTNMPTFMNSIYMSVNFGVSSLIVFGVGSLGDFVGLESTYKICAALAFVCIPLSTILAKITKICKGFN